MSTASARDDGSLAPGGSRPSRMARCNDATMAARRPSPWSSSRCRSRPREVAHSDAMKLDHIAGPPVRYGAVMTSLETHPIQPRLLAGKQAPAVYRAMSAFDRAIELDPPLRELVKIRASQLNGCAYCLDMHTRDARAGGEDE